MKTRLHPEYLSFIFILFISVPLFAQKTFSDFPPAEVTREMDYQQMLLQMGISFPNLPPILEDPNAPDYAFPRDSLNPDGN